MCDIVFEKTKDRGRKVNRASVNAEAVSEKFLKKGLMRINRIHKKTSVAESLFGVFL